MAVCPCCRELLPASDGPNELCAKCARALETGADNSPSTPGAQPALDSANDNPDEACAEHVIAKPDKSPVPRPLGVTVLALQQYLIAVCCLLAAIIGLVELRLVLVLAALLISWLMYKIASGLWRLKDWARWVAIVLSLLSLLSLKPWVLFPLYVLLGCGPIVIICTCVITILVIIYLLSPRIDSAFGVSPLGLKWRLAVIALALVFFVIPLTRAKPELNAIKWHLRHGNQVSVNGVSFPVYLWHVPVECPNNTSFSIDDEPGPLRPMEQRSFITVDCCKDADRNSTPAELADQRYKSDQNAGYFDMRRYQMRVRGQTLECMQSDIASVTHRIDCYGEGPIYSVFFSGNGDASLARFNRMMAEAR
jgi:hypothetical protein